MQRGQNSRWNRRRADSTRGWPSLWSTARCKEWRTQSGYFSASSIQWDWCPFNCSTSIFALPKNKIPCLRVHSGLYFLQMKDDFEVYKGEHGVPADGKLHWVVSWRCDLLCDLSGGQVTPPPQGKWAIKDFHQLFADEIRLPTLKVWCVGGGGVDGESQAIVKTSK